MERARVRVSPKFQIVIPKSIREELHIEPGQDLVMYSLEGTIRILLAAPSKNSAAPPRA